MSKTVFVSLDRHDLEILIDGYSMEFVEKIDPAMMHTPAGEAKNAHDDTVRPIVKKLADFVKEWEELDEKEQKEQEQKKAEVQTAPVAAITRTVTSA